MTPRLALIVHQIAVVMSAPESRAELLGLVSLLASKHAEALVRMFEMTTPTTDEPRNLTAAEAAKILGTSVRWMYDHAHELECTRHPSPGKLRFDSVGVQRLRDIRR